MKVVAVIVTHNSAEYIERLLRELLSQNISLHTIYVIDTASIDNTVKKCQQLADTFEGIKVYDCKENIGGAGGYRLGLELALKDSCKAEYIITFDDDAEIFDLMYLQKLITFAKKNSLDVTGSLVVSSSNFMRTAHKYLLKNKRTTDVKKLQENADSVKEVKLFNGTLFSAKVVQNLKGPNPKFFIRGDEVEFRARIIRAKYKVATCVDAVLYHPEITSDERKYCYGIVSYIEHPGKQYFSTRNRFYIYKKRIKHKHSYPKMIGILLLDFIRHTLYYLFNKKDISGYRLWSKAYLDGVSGNLNSEYSKKIKDKYFV